MKQICQIGKKRNTLQIALCVNRCVLVPGDFI